MSKIFTIDGKDYKVEYTIEASLYNDCTEKTVGLMTRMLEASGENAIKDIISSMSDIPGTTLTMFYAGLLEHHGLYGDGSVKDINDAKRLVKLYFSEHKDDDLGNFYSLMEILIEQMSEDGFFKQIGLEQMMKQMSEQTEQSPAKKTKKTKVGEK